QDRPLLESFRKLTTLGPASVCGPFIFELALPLGRPGCARPADSYISNTAMPFCVVITPALAWRKGASLLFYYYDFWG
ncbi:MAG: hypothetical protein J7M14_02905, partial [Planctomycetes bacterium]|nr:hypothetical protein [Planctomycetota bacterium]